MRKFLPTDLSIKSFIKNGVFASLLLISSFASAQLQRATLEKVDTNRAVISQQGFDNQLKSVSPAKFEMSDKELATVPASRTYGPSVVNGSFEWGNQYWSRYYAHTVHASSHCGGNQVMKLYGAWCGDGGVVRGYLNNLTPGETYTLNWKEYVWNGHASDYYVYVDGYNHIDNANNHTGWVSRSITFTASAHCQYLWFLNYSHNNLYIDCIDVEEDGVNCDDLAFDLADQEICVGDTAVINGPDGFDSYLWSTGETTQNITVTPEVTSVYSITATLGDCEVSNALEVKLHEPFGGIEGPAEICIGEDATLTVVGEEGLTYVWSTGETTESITVSPTEDTVYTVTLNDGTCTSVEHFTVNVTDITFDLADQTILSGETTVITAPDGMDTYLWSTGEATQQIVVSPDTNTVYSITVTRFGCEYTNFVEVVVTLDDNGNGGSGHAMETNIDARVSIDGILSIDANASRNMQIEYQVYALSGLSSATSNRALKADLTAGNNAIRVNLNQHYNLRANTYYVLVINSADLDSPKRIKFIAR